jgi:AcrR family transcriptional regulator
MATDLRQPRLGRPRAEPGGPPGEPREVILDVAAGLFTTVGYARTTTREVARAAGLRQASLFHYFARKDAVLAELLDRTVDPALQFLRALERREGAPEVKLASLVRRDVENLCSGPHNLGALQLLPEVRPGVRPGAEHSEPFAPFWAKRAQLRSGYRRFIRAAMATGAYPPAPLELSTDIVFGLVESVISWYDRRARRRPAPVEVAEAVAVAAGRALGAGPSCSAPG